jgi:hypothetical protein
MIEECLVNLKALVGEPLNQVSKPMWNESGYVTIFEPLNVKKNQAKFVFISILKTCL